MARVWYLLLQLHYQDKGAYSSIKNRHQMISLFSIFYRPAWKIDFEYYVANLVNLW